MARRLRYTDTAAYIDFMRRIIHAAGERLADTDPEQLRELIYMRDELDAAIARAVTGMRDSGATWAEIGAATGTSRQAAHEKWASVA